MVVKRKGDVLAFRKSRKGIIFPPAFSFFFPYIAIEYLGKIEIVDSLVGESSFPINIVIQFPIDRNFEK